MTKSTISRFTVRPGGLDKRYLNSREAQRFLGYATLHAFICAYPKLGIRPYRLGRSLRFLEEDLEAAVSRAEVVPEEDRRRRG
jgi:hypothetical protein